MSKTITLPADAQSIQAQLREMDKIMTRVLAHLSNVNNGQTSHIFRDLKQISKTVNTLDQEIIGFLETQHRQMESLVGVGSAINSSFGLKRVLELVMDSLITLMNAERGFLMLRDPNGELKVRIARGIESVNLDKEAFTISNTVVRRVIETGESVLTTNAQEDPRFGEQFSVSINHLLSILCAPLKIKDDLIGVIYVDNRAYTGIFHKEDLGIISAFANQAAVAIENARLFDDLQGSKAELEIAYEASLEGWVRALDLRDKETEGHTQRVTTVTQRLARSMGVSEDALIHIKRGALLHDIGKMGIPDIILLKPGSLTEEERMVIQKHPIYAYEMLKPIQFLSPALDIPYCHHEKWDGSGYPRGLKMDEIPFIARIFCIVDVWDALVSDRPYRKGLNPAVVRNMITEQSDIHFDPRVVEAFLALDIILY